MEKGFAVFVLFWATVLSLYFLPEVRDFWDGRLTLSRSGDSQNSLVYISADQGETFVVSRWHTEARPKINDVETDPDDPKIMYAATDKGLFVSRDLGYNWYPFIDLEGILKDKAAYSLETVKGNPSRTFIALYGQGRGEVYESSDRFFSVKRVYDILRVRPLALSVRGKNLDIGLSDGRLISYEMEEKGFSLEEKFPSSVISIAEREGRTYVITESNGVFARTGQKFENIRGGTASSIAVFGQKLVYAVSSAQIFQSSSLGKRWDQMKTINPPGVKIESVSVDSTGDIFFAAGSKVYRSSDNGKSWKVIFDAGKRKTHFLKIDKDDRIILALY